MTEVTPEFLARFWAKVDRRKDDECWPWTGSLSFVTTGYGQMGGPGRRPLKTHRVSWELHFGPIPADLHVLHRCDNPPCVNPSHLFLGTDADNMADMVAKGRAGGKIFHGEANAAARLTAQQVRELRRRVENGETQRSMAKEFGISTRTVNLIVLRKAWKHV